MQRLAENYPRGNKELKGSFFYAHGPADTVSWFSEHGVPLKVPISLIFAYVFVIRPNSSIQQTEEDGRVFPVSDNSSSVVDCLLHEATIRGGIIKTSSSSLFLPSLHSYIHIQFHEPVRLERGKSVLSASTQPDGKFLVKVGKRTADVSESIQASYLLIATGSSQQVTRRT